MAASRRTALALALPLLVAGVAASACQRSLRTAELVLDPHPGVVYAIATPAPLVALTIDDGPDPIGTPAILDVLARHGARATFFLLGERVEGQEALVARIVAAGHEIGNHGMRDVPAIELAPEVFERDLVETGRRLAPFGASRWYRPGSGWYDEAMLEVVARHGHRLALGSSYPLDAHVPASAFARWWLRVDAEPGEVMVLHDGPERGRRTAATLDALLPALAREGLAVVTLSELVAAGEAPDAPASEGQRRHAGGAGS